MKRFRRVPESETSFKLYFNCPGCRQEHAINSIGWQFDGNFEKPTISPSVLVTWGGTDRRCHSFIKKGMIEFLSDCSHELKNQTVDLIPYE